MTHELRIETIVFVVLFMTLYLLFLLNKIFKKEIDLYDLLILSTCGFVPAAFVLLPEIPIFISKKIGVEFPFVLLFGSLFAISFFYQYYLIKRVHRLEKKLLKLAQRSALKAIDVEN